MLIMYNMCYMYCMYSIYMMVCAYSNDDMAYACDMTIKKRRGGDYDIINWRREGRFREVNCSM